MTEDIKELLILYALDELEGNELQEAQTLAQSPQYAPFVEQIRKTNALLAATYQELTPANPEAIRMAPKPQNARFSRRLFWSTISALVVLIAIPTLALLLPTFNSLRHSGLMVAQTKIGDASAYPKPAEDALEKKSPEVQKEFQEAAESTANSPVQELSDSNSETTPAPLFPAEKENEPLSVVDAAPVDAAPVDAASVVAASVVVAPVEAAAPIVAADSFLADPVVADPVVADPVVADPVVADPVVADPVVADPVVADPVVSSRLYNSPISNETVDNYSAQKDFDAFSLPRKQLSRQETITRGVSGYNYSGKMGLRGEGTEGFRRGMFFDAETSQDTAELGTQELENRFSAAVDTADVTAGVTAADTENSFENPKIKPFSTFGVDVDTASYTIMRSCADNNIKPPKESVRIEEYINYFDYDLPEPGKDSDCPFAAHAEIGRHPWADGLLLAKIGIQGGRLSIDELPPMNLVFLIDVSGSMSDYNKLSWVKESMKQLVERLRPQDFAAIVTYSSKACIFLEPISGRDKSTILGCIDELTANGSTNGSGGIELAYKMGRRHFDKESINRVILCSDGDFNVGTTSLAALEKQISQEAQSGIFLSVLGFGMRNYSDGRMERLADKGNGNYAYIDSLEEAKRVLDKNLSGTLATIAKDVKLQVDFNPRNVKSYRLIGYENRVMAAQDFNNDRKDSGDIGAGHKVVALYEIVPTGKRNPLESNVDASRYAEKDPDSDSDSDSKSKPGTSSEEKLADELFLVKIRYKRPQEDKSEYKDFPVMVPSESQLDNVSPDFRFAAAVALAGQILRESRYCGSADWKTVETLLDNAKSDDPQRKEFRKLIEKVR